MPIRATLLLPWAVDRVGLPRILVLPYDDPTLNWDGGVTAGVGAMPDAISETEWKMLLLRSFRQLAMARLPELLTARYRFSSTTTGVPWFVRRKDPGKADRDGRRIPLWVDLAMIDARRCSGRWPGDWRPCFVERQTGRRRRRRHGCSTTPTTRAVKVTIREAMSTDQVRQ
jgi:hypothetical protein